MHIPRGAVLSPGGQKPASTEEAWKKKNVAEKKNQRIFRGEGCAAFRLPLYLLEGTASSGKCVPTQTGEGASSSMPARLGCTQWVLWGLRGTEQHQEPNTIQWKKAWFQTTQNSCCSQSK